MKSLNQKVMSPCSALCVIFGKKCWVPNTYDEHMTHLDEFQDNNIRFVKAINLYCFVWLILMQKKPFSSRYILTIMFLPSGVMSLEKVILYKYWQIILFSGLLGFCHNSCM